MAAYIGSVQGSRGSVSRLGGADAGVRSSLAGWSGAVYTHIHHKDGVPWLYVELQKHRGQGLEGVLYSGPLADAPIRAFGS